MLDNYQHVEAVLAAFVAGEIIIVADDDDRENEGDLFVAASLCTPEKMAFIMRHTSGIGARRSQLNKPSPCTSIPWWLRTMRRSALPLPSRSIAAMG